MGRHATSVLDSLTPLTQPVAVACSEYNAEVMSHYTDSFLSGIAQYLPSSDMLKQVWVPGALELSYALRLLAKAEPAPGVLVALGCVIRGDTYHFEVVSEVSAHAIQRVSEAADLPVINGILTCDNQEQAMQRSKVKGEAAAHAAVKMASLGKAKMLWVR